MGEATPKKLATEMKEKLRASTAVDWQVREAVRAKMRIVVKQLLLTYKYAPEGQDEAGVMVLKQAEALANSWTR